MIRSIVGTSFKFRLLVVAVAAAVLGIGIYQLRGAAVDVLPEFTPPYVEIHTEALGLSADEVEQFITVPLEADLLNGVEGVDVIRSESLPGLSSVVLVFAPGTDVYRGRQLVSERLIQAHALPNVSTPPVMLQPLSSSSRVLMVGLSSEKLTPIEKSLIARWTMRPRLTGVPGVANVAIWGQRDQEVQVQVDPRRLRDRDVTLSQVVKTAGNAQIASPLSFLEASTPGTGGFIETPQQRLQVRNVFEKLADPRELGKVPVEETNGRLRLTDVADVKIGNQPLIGDAVVNDRDGLLLVVEKLPGANTAVVTKGIEDALNNLRPGLAGMRTDTSVFRPATFIEAAKGNIGLAVLIAGALLALVLAAFLFAWRTLLVALVTIPVAIVAGAFALKLLGQTFNAISFAGLAAAVAVIVADTVTSADNVARRMRLRRDADGGEPIADVIGPSLAEVRSPLTYATLIALVPMVPIAVMEGRPGAFFEPLALSYVVAIAVAMVVALVLTPALSLLVFSRGRPGRGESPILTRLARRYEGALGRAARSPKAILIGAGAGLVVALAMLPLLGVSLIPAFKDQNVLVRLAGEAGTSNPRMTGIATQLSRDLRAIPGVENVGAHVGRAITGDQIVDVNSSELWVSIGAGADYEGTLAQIQDTVDGVGGIQGREVVTHSTQSINEVGAVNEGDNGVRGTGLNVLTGSDRPLAVRLFGQDIDVLTREAERVRQMMAGVDGVVAPRVDLPRRQETLEIEVDLAKARRFGIKPGDVRRAEGTLIQGLQVGSVFQGQKVFEVKVQGDPATYRNADSVRDMLIDRPGGGQVRLGDVADVRISQIPAVIQRDAVSRRVDVVADVSGRSAGDVAADIETRLANTRLPLEYHAEVLQGSTGQEMGAWRMLAFTLAAVLAVFLLLQAAFRSWRVAALAFLTLPLALVGGVLAALVYGAELSLGSLVGLLAVFGIAAGNAVSSLTHFGNIERDEGLAFGPELVARGAGERLAPVLTSAVALGVAMLPFIVLGGSPGLEIIAPMAAVVLGGLVSSTLVALFVLPALYLRFGGSERALSEQDELMHRWAGVDPATAGAGARGAVVPATSNGGEDDAVPRRRMAPSSAPPDEPAPSGAEQRPEERR